MKHRLTCFALLTLLSLSSCAGDIYNHETPVYSGEAEQVVEKLTFGLPSVRDSGAIFKEGKQIDVDIETTQRLAIKPETLVNGTNYEDGSITMLRQWLVIYNSNSGEYCLRSGGYRISFFEGSQRRIRPTTEVLRHLFGKWIIFAGDDMRRVREVPGGNWGHQLVFNDGRLPNDTFAPDVKKR